MKLEDLLEYIGYVFVVASGFPLGYIFWKVVILLFAQPVGIPFEVIVR